MATNWSSSKALSRESVHPCGSSTRMRWANLDCPVCKNAYCGEVAVELGQHGLRQTEEQHGPNSAQHLVPVQPAPAATAISCCATVVHVAVTLHRANCRIKWRYL